MNFRKCLSMKTKMKTTLTMCLLAGITSALLPINSLANDDENKTVEKKAKPACTWIGVSTVPLPELVSEHVGLNKGEGVMVEAVLAGSPAEKAGIMKRDILTHADAEVIAGAQALSKLVATKKCGDTIVLNIRRKNESKQVLVELAEKPKRIALSGQKPEPAARFPLGGNAIDQRLARVIERMEDLDSGLADALEAQAGAIVRVTATPGNGAHQRMEISLADNEGRLSVSTINDKTSVKLWDTEGKVLFEGPYTTEEEKKAVPENLRKRIDKVSAENPTRLWVFEGFRNPDDQPDDETPDEE